MTQIKHQYLRTILASSAAILVSCTGQQATKLVNRNNPILDAIYKPTITDATIRFGSSNEFSVVLGTAYAKVGNDFVPITRAVTESDKGVVVTTTYTNDTSSPVWLEGFLPLGDELLASTIAIPGSGQLRQLVNGHSIFSYSGVVNLDDTSDLDPLVPIGDLLKIGSEKIGQSWWSTALRWSNGTNVLSIGTLGVDVWKTFISVLHINSQTNLVVAQGLDGDRIQLAPGESAQSEPIHISAGTGHVAVLENYAQAFADAYPPLVSKHEIFWSSWHSDFSEISATKIDERLAEVNAANQEYGLAIEGIQIDDGYQQQWGDWNSNDVFPSGLTGLSDQIASAGFEPGLWMALSLATEKSQTAISNPDWILYGPDGDEVVCGVCSAPGRDVGQMLVLDPSIAAVQEFTTYWTDHIADVGFEFLKLDFTLFSGAPARPANPQSSLQAYRSFLDDIIAGADDRMQLLIAGSPFMAVASKAHSTRFAPDLGMEAQADELTWAPIHHIIRNIYARSHFIHTVARPDPDAIFVRGEVPAGEVRAMVTAWALSGGYRSYGFRGSDTSHSAFNLLANPAINQLWDDIAYANLHAFPVDLFDEADDAIPYAPLIDLLTGIRNSTTHAPRILRSPIINDRQYLAIFNYDEDEHSTTIDLSAWGFEKSWYIHSELWGHFEDEELPQHGATVNFTGRDAMLFELARAQ